MIHYLLVNAFLDIMMEVLLFAILAIILVWNVLVLENLNANHALSEPHREFHQKVVFVNLVIMMMGYSLNVFHAILLVVNVKVNHTSAFHVVQQGN